MPFRFSLKTLAWSWGVLLTACGAGAVALQVVDVVPPPEPPPTIQAAASVAAVQPTAPLFAAPVVAAPPAAPPVIAPPPALARVEPPKPRPVREAALPVPPVPPRMREARASSRPILRAYASESQWPQPPMQAPYWRAQPYPGQYYAYSQPWTRVQGPPSYYAWPPAE